MLRADPEPKNFLRYIQLILIVLLSFISGLQVPKISIFAFLAIVPLALLNDLMGLPRLLIIEKMFKKQSLLPFLSLLFFSITYFCTLQYYQINSIDNDNAVILNVSRFIFYYILGTCLNYPRLPYYPYNPILIFLSLVTASTIFIFLCVTKVTFASLVLFTVNKATIPNFWSGDDLHIRNVDMFNSLTLSLFPILIFGKNRLTRRWEVYHFIFLPIALITLLAIYSSLALQGRTPVIVFLISLAISTIFIFSKNGKYRLKFLLTLFVVAFLGTLLINPAEIWSKLSFQDYFQRFDSEGLESLRYEAWMTVLNQMFNYPSGGKQFPLPGTHLWAHNLWLDTIYEAGILPCVLLIVFQILHGKAFLKVFSANLPPIVSLSSVGIAVAFGLTFLIQPIMAASIEYFAIFCFFLGTVKSLADDINRQNEQNRSIHSPYPVFYRSNRG